MLKRGATLLGMVALSAVLWFAGQRYAMPAVMRAFWSVALIAVVYFLGKIVGEYLLMTRVNEVKTRYTLRKSLSLLVLAVSLLIVVTIWIPDPTALLVAYGLLGAGVAVALQDVFKNLAGSIALVAGGIYEVGDRIEVDGVHGDVIDIGLSYTRVLEIKEWVTGDQATGRIVTIPNGRVLGSDINNYTTDNTFLWDEIAIPITYDSNRERAEMLIHDIVEEETADLTDRAAGEIADIQKRYYMTERDTSARVFVEATDNWTMLYVRYIADVRERREYHARISRRIIDALQDADDIEIASETVTVTAFQGEK